MPKQLLTGTLDEQCAFLYDLAQQKMTQGNYTGAAHALQEIVKYAPGYRDAAELLGDVKRRKREQSLLVLISFAGASLFIGAGTLWQVPNDLWFLGLAIVGALLGFLVGSALFTRRSGRAAPSGTAVGGVNDSGSRAGTAEPQQ
jgi:hypothetical protein